MIVIFVLGYLAITLEHPLKIDKAASALFIGVLAWTVYILGADKLLAGSENFAEYLNLNPDSDAAHFVGHELSYFLAHISEIIFFLLGAMTIVELIDAHEGFDIITDKIQTTNKVKLLWIICILTFFFSAALDNLTTSIVMISLLRKLIGGQKDRWFFAGMVVISANAGGAWSPIGDVTTTMLWIGDQITAMNVITRLIVPSFVCMIVPLIISSFMVKGNITRPDVIIDEHANNIRPKKMERRIVFIAGVALLLFVPVFKTVTHLPPYMGMLFSLSILWIITEVMHRQKNVEEKSNLSVIGILRKIDTPSVLFFLGILVAISSLQSAGHLTDLAGILRERLNNVYAIDFAIGLLSAIVDNVPLVAASMGMYDVTTPAMLASTPPDQLVWAKYFVQDGRFWEFLAYCAGTGGSILIIGSAAGVAVMGLEKIDFFWYLRKIGSLALVGYIAGAATYLLLM